MCCFLSHVVVVSPELDLNRLVYDQISTPTVVHQSKLPPFSHKPCEQIA
jgi:hypothetical protein